MWHRSGSSVLADEVDDEVDQVGVAGEQSDAVAAARVHLELPWLVGGVVHRLGAVGVTVVLAVDVQARHGYSGDRRRALLGWGRGDGDDTVDGSLGGSGEREGSTAAGAEPPWRPRRRCAPPGRRRRRW